MEADQGSVFGVDGKALNDAFLRIHLMMVRAAKDVKFHRLGLTPVLVALLAVKRQMMRLPLPRRALSSINGHHCTNYFLVAIKKNLLNNYTLIKIFKFRIKHFRIFSAMSATGNPSIPYPTYCYARYCFKFERALSHSSGGSGVDQLLFAGVGNGDALV